VVRVWLPDRPGALGAVASRIGAVGGDLVGIDILERGGGQAIDELVISLPRADLLELLVAEMSEVDGVAVEAVRPAAEALRDPRLDALEAAAMLVGAQSPVELLDVLCEHVVRDFSADWAVVADLDDGQLCAGVGPAPSLAWLQAFVAGSRASARVASGDAGPDDVAWAPLPSTGLVLALARMGSPIRSRERRQAAALARIADVRVAELVVSRSRRNHPSSS